VTHNGLMATTFNFNSYLLPTKIAFTNIKKNMTVYKNNNNVSEPDGV
jgi:hypothetical protein